MPDSLGILKALGRPNCQVGGPRACWSYQLAGDFLRTWQHVVEDLAQRLGIDKVTGTAWGEKAQMDSLFGELLSGFDDHLVEAVLYSATIPDAPACARLGFQSEVAIDQPYQPAAREGKKWQLNRVGQGLLVIPQEGLHWVAPSQSLMQGAHARYLIKGSPDWLKERKPPEQHRAFGCSVGPGEFSHNGKVPRFEALDRWLKVWNGKQYEPATEPAALELIGIKADMPPVYDAHELVVSVHMPITRVDRSRAVSKIVGLTLDPESGGLLGVSVSFSPIYGGLHEGANFDGTTGAMWTATILGR